MVFQVLMLTLQNDPPSLDSGAEDKEQYKAYGKTFRKMISECLQKDPSKRPTATELLKHQFFKNKAKDKSWLQKTLVANAPSIEARVPRQKPQRGASGRLHRNPDGDWVWSSDSDDESDEEDSSHPASAEPRNPSPVAPAKQLEQLSMVLLFNPQRNQKIQKLFFLFKVEVNQKTLNIVLRMRNRRKELNDIRFEYQPTKDTADGIAQELLSTGTPFFLLFCIQQKKKNLQNSRGIVMVLSDCCELTNFFWILNQTHKFVSNRYIHLNHLNFTNFFPPINFNQFRYFYRVDL